MSVHISIDRPSTSEWISAELSFGGWALSDTALISTITYSIDEGANAPCVYGSARADVAAAWPNRPGAPSYGWNIWNVDTTKLTNGSHVLGITATDALGATLTVSVTFIVVNFPVTSQGGAGPIGPAGPAGRGITGTATNSDGHLIVTYSDGTTTDAGLVVGSSGTNGINGSPGPQGPVGP